jgi:hypothetical protein
MDISARGFHHIINTDMKIMLDKILIDAQFSWKAWLNFRTLCCHNVKAIKDKNTLFSFFFWNFLTKIGGA